MDADDSGGRGAAELGVTMSHGSYIPLLSKEGCSRHQTERREATLCGANGVVLIEPRSVPFFVEVTNHHQCFALPGSRFAHQCFALPGSRFAPGCALKERDLLLMAQPPLLEKAELSKLRVDGNVNCN